ncbi:MAG: cell division protein FtsQ/DivIB [Acidobacteriota bacterium]
MRTSSTRSTIRAAEASPYLRPGRNHVLRRSRRRRFVRHGAVVAGFAAVALTGVVWGGATAWRWLTSTPLLTVQAVSLTGVRRADRDGLRVLLKGLTGENLLAIDLAAVRATLVADPWVSEAAVRREFPHTLSVRIEEKQPVAVALVDGVPAVVDGTGRIIAPWPARLGVLDLPLITGLAGGDGSAARIRTGISALTALARHDPELIAALSEIDVSQEDRLTARFIGESVPVLLSREDVTANIDHYLEVRDDIHHRVAAIGAIDLRWRGRVVIVPAPAGDGKGQRHV